MSAGCTREEMEARARRRDLASLLAVVPQESSFSFPFTVLQTVLMGRHPHLAGLAFETQQDVELARAALAEVSWCRQVTLRLHPEDAEGLAASHPRLAEALDAPGVALLEKIT